MPESLPLFDPNEWPDAKHTDVLLVTPETLILQFVHRNGYNATAQARMEKELRELLTVLGVRL